MDKKNSPITLLKQHETLNYIIVLLSILGKEESDKEIIHEGSKVIIKPRDKNEITKLNRDTSALKDKIHHFLRTRTMYRLDLNDEESDLLRHCSHASYYFLTEKQKTFSPAQNAFIKFHEHYFR